jgi:hypothetical protein
MFFEPSAAQSCPGGGIHDAGTSGKYVVHLGDAANTAQLQNGWRFCAKCAGLFFSQDGQPFVKVCPAGDFHDARFSGTYVMEFGADGPGAQGNWRFCKNCLGLFFLSGPFTEFPNGVCTAEESANLIHDGSLSGPYHMLFEPPPPPPPPPPTYSFAFSFGIDQIRSAHTDTLFVSTSLRVLDANGALHHDFGSQGGPLGDHRAGDTVPGLVFNNVDVPPPTPENPDGGSVYWVILLVNNGHADSGFAALLNKTADTFAGAFAGRLLDPTEKETGLFAALTTGVLIGQEVLNLLTADCDGQVAASRLPAFTALQLSSKVPKPGQSFDITEDNPGDNSPAGCGENSDYKINYRIEQNLAGL